MPASPGHHPLSTIHCPWTVGPFRPSLVRGDAPRSAPLAMPPCVRVPSCRVGVRRVDAPVPARFQPAADTTRTRRQRTCAAPAVRITNHESRVTAVLDGRAVPALPCAGGRPPQRPPVAVPPCVRVPSIHVSADRDDPPFVRDSSLSPTRLGHDATVSTRRQPIASSTAVLPRRWVVERTFAWPSCHRRLRKDYEYDTLAARVSSTSLPSALLRFVVSPPLLEFQTGTKRTYV